MAAQATQARALYRRFLRELPARTPSILANPSPLQKHVRADFATTHSTAVSPQRKLEEVEQHLQYLKAQRIYTTLLERYNPGMDMSDEERVRLSARRVGMNLPIELQQDGGNGGSGGHGQS